MLGETRGILDDSFAQIEPRSCGAHSTARPTCGGKSWGLGKGGKGKVKKVGQGILISVRTPNRGFVNIRRCLPAVWQVATRTAGNSWQQLAAAHSDAAVDAWRVPLPGRYYPGKALQR